jgi:hypothetical protein
MNWIFDQPYLIVLLSVALLSVLAIGWVMSGQKMLLYALIGCGLLAVALLITERMVTTDREAIEATLQQMARDVASNQPNNITRHISPTAPQLVSKANAELPNYRFTSLRITKIHEIKVSDAAQPKTAVVEFNIVASGTFSAGGETLADADIPRWVQLDLIKDEDGQWRVRDYSHAPPQQMLFENLELPQSLQR